jgi:Family of unknown function (DUF5681)
MAKRTEKGQFAKGESGNPGGRPKLPSEMREIFQSKAPEAFEVLCRHLHATDPRVALAAATQILDRAYGRPVQSIDANISEGAIRFVEIPRKAESVAAWLSEVGRPLIAGAADDEQKH